MPTAHLADRGVIRVSGEEARAWLNNLVTCDVASLKPGEARLGALLTPQGKIIADFLISEAPDGAFLLDAPRGLAPDLAKRLTLYRLRAKIAIEDISEWILVAAEWDAEPASGRGAVDGRLAALGRRWILGKPDADLVQEDPGRVKAAAYHAHRIALGIPQGGQDFAYGDAFPHEADMDQLGGIDFRKGCYVGQEVVSRMQHRGSGGRTRVVPVVYEGGFAASEGIEVKAGDKILGSTGSNANGRGLAKLRLDRVEDAIKAKETLIAGGIPLKLVKPAWATFRFPGEDAAS